MYRLHWSRTKHKMGLNQGSREADVSTGFVMAQCYLSPLNSLHAVTDVVVVSLSTKKGEQQEICKSMLMTNNTFSLYFSKVKIYPILLGLL